MNIIVDKQYILVHSIVHENEMSETESSINSHLLFPLLFLEGDLSKQ